MSDIADEVLGLPTIQLIVQKDRFAQLMGVKIEAIRVAYARVSMLVEEKHFNGVDIVQGGALFALADYAFALASNSHGITAVGLESSISFFKPTHSGTLYAEATEQFRSKSLGAFDVTVTNDAGITVAIFHGRCFFRA